MGGATGRAVEIVGVVGGAVDIVVALPVDEPHRHVGLTEDHAARLLDAGNRQRVFRWPEILLRRGPPCRVQPRAIEGFLPCLANAEQPAVLTAPQRRVSAAGTSPA